MAAQHLAMHRTAPAMTNVPNIISAAFERPRPKRIMPSSFPFLRAPLKCHLLRKTIAPASSTAGTPPPPISCYWPAVGFPSLSLHEL